MIWTQERARGGKERKEKGRGREAGRAGKKEVSWAVCWRERDRCMGEEADVIRLDPCLMKPVTPGCDLQGRCDKECVKWNVAQDVWRLVEWKRNKGDHRAVPLIHALLSPPLPPSLTSPPYHVRFSLLLREIILISGSWLKNTWVLKTDVIYIAYLL